jgi:hypothetical protein
MAEQIMRSAALPQGARDEVQRLAQQLRQAPAATVVPAAATPVATAGPPSASTHVRAPVAAGGRPTPRADARLAPSMLERFGGIDHATESTP